MSLLGRATISLVAIGLLGTLSAPAFAGTYSHRDARHDVGRTPDDTHFKRAPANRDFDITRLEVIHTKTHVQFQVRLRSTSLKHLDWRTLDFHMTTSGHHFSGQLKTTTYGELQAQLWDTDHARERRCRETTLTKGNTVWWTLPNSCFKRPSWFRVAFSVEGQAGGKTYRDNAQSRSWRHPLTDVFSPRIRAGA